MKRGKVVKSVLRILACVAVVALIVGTGCVNSLMFHPEACKGGYGESTEGYVDIGTNGVKIAAIVLGPERGKKAILRCHGSRTAWLYGRVRRLSRLRAVGWHS